MLTALIFATSPIFAILGGMVSRERVGSRLAFGAGVTLAGVFLATLAHARWSGAAGRRLLRRPNSRRRTAAPLSHWMPSVGLSSLGQASTQLVMVWQR